MCNFSGSKATLINKKGITLPIPIEEETIDPDDAIIAWRSWAMEVGGRLVGTYITSAEWEPGKTMVAHSLGSHGNSGLYAFEEEGRAMDQGGRVWGQVALWGNIYHHRSRGGFRAQYGYPLSLFTIDKGWAKRLADLYGPSGVYVNLATSLDARSPGKITFVN